MAKKNEEVNPKGRVLVANKFALKSLNSLAKKSEFKL